MKRIIEKELEEVKKGRKEEGERCLENIIIRILKERNMRKEKGERNYKCKSRRECKSKERGMKVRRLYMKI